MKVCYISAIKLSDKRIQNVLPNVSNNINNFFLSIVIYDMEFSLYLIT